MIPICNLFKSCLLIYPPSVRQAQHFSPQCSTLCSNYFLSYSSQCYTCYQNPQWSITSIQNHLVFFTPWSSAQSILLYIIFLQLMRPQDCLNLLSCNSQRDPSWLQLYIKIAFTQNYYVYLYCWYLPSSFQKVLLGSLCIYL